MAQIVIDMPDVGYIVTHNLDVVLAAVAFVLAGAVLSLLVFIHKTRYYKVHAEPMIKKAVAKLLVGYATAFSLAGGLLSVAASQEPILAAVGSVAPDVARHIPMLLGIAYALYNFGMDRRFKAVYGVLEAWSNNRKHTGQSDDVSSVTVPAELVPAPPSPVGHAAANETDVLPNLLQ